MPELPEVETVMRGLESSILGARVTKVNQRRANLRIPFPENLSQRLSGAVFQSFERRAKYIFIHLDDGNILIIHLGMSGRISVVTELIDSYKPEKHDHLLIGFDSGQTFVFNDTRRFGMVMLMGPDDLARHPAFVSLGPEPLGNEFNGPVLHAAFAGKKTPVKTALLDQRVVSGVGNIYACEALFMAGLHPERPACSLSIDEVDCLSRTIKKVLASAIKAGGSTLKDYRHVSGDTGYFQYDFGVYDKKGMACPGCDCDIIKTGGVAVIRQSGRSTFFCPVIQK